MTTSGYVCNCPKIGHSIGICISWDNGIVSGYDCKYPNCPKSCKLLKDYPIGATHACLKDSDS